MGWLVRPVFREATNTCYLTPFSTSARTSCTFTYYAYKANIYNTFMHHLHRPLCIICMYIKPTSTGTFTNHFHVSSCFIYVCLHISSTCTCPTSLLDFLLLPDGDVSVPSSLSWPIWRTLSSTYRQTRAMNFTKRQNAILSITSHPLYTLLAINMRTHSMIISYISHLLEIFLVYPSLPCLLLMEALWEKIPIHLVPTCVSQSHVAGYIQPKDPGSTRIGLNKRDAAENLLLWTLIKRHEGWKQQLHNTPNDGLWVNL